MKRLPFAIVAALMVPLICWIGGMELNQRGESQAAAFFFTIFVFAMSYALPDWSDK